MDSVCAAHKGIGGSPNVGEKWPLEQLPGERVGSRRRASCRYIDAAKCDRPKKKSEWARKVAWKNPSLPFSTART